MKGGVSPDDCRKDGGAGLGPPVSQARRRHTESECVFTTTCPARRVISQRNLDVGDTDRVLWKQS